MKRSGVKIGSVRRVTLDETTGRVEVLIQIDNGHILPRGDRATLTQGVLGGDATIAFLPPPGKKDVDMTPVEPGAVLEGVAQADTGTLLQRTTDVINPAEEALKEIKKSLERLTPAAENTLKDIRDTLPPAATTIQQNVQKLSPSVEKVLDKIDKAMPVIEMPSPSLTNLLRSSRRPSKNSIKIRCRASARVLTNCKSSPRTGTRSANGSTSSFAPTRTS